MSGESPVVELYDSNGTPLSVQNGSAIPASTPGLLFMGSDGTNSRYVLLDSSGRPVMVGAGTAGTPAGGVVSIQGVASGTTVPVSGTLGATQNGNIDAGNSSTTTLAGNGTFTGASLDVSVYGVVTVFVFTDQAGTLNLEWSINGTNWDDVNSYAVSASTALSIQFGPQARFFRVVYQNGSSAQGTFRLQTIERPITAFPETVPASYTIANSDNVLLTKTVQGTSPWVENITQFGGNNVVTGTGAGGIGIPRVTVSNDSNVLATQSGSWTVTANQGTANTIANSWPVEVTDGTNILGTSAHPLRIDPTGTTTQPVSGTVTSNQGTSPWVTNVTQFGNNNVVTGTGASGVGIPRVTVSNDSNILATQSGTWTVQQGTPPWLQLGNQTTESTAAWTSATAGNTALALTVTGYGTVTVTFNQTTTITGGVVTFEVSDTVAGTNWYPISAISTAGATVPSTTYTLQQSTNASFQTNVAGYVQFRVRLSTTISGTGTVNVGVAANASSAEWQQATYITDASHGPVAVKAGSTASVAGDSSLVTAFSPNSPLPTGSNVVGALVANQSVNVAQIAGSTTSTAATGVQKVGIVGGTGTSLESTAGVVDHNLKNVANSAVATAATGVQKVGIVGNTGTALDGSTAGVVDANIKNIGNSAVATLAAGEQKVAVEGLGASGSATSGNPVLVAGADPLNAHTLLTDTNGRQIVVGAAASGGALTGNPVLVAGSDSVDARSIRTDSVGFVQTIYNQFSTNATTNTISAQVTPGSSGTVTVVRKTAYTEQTANFTGSVSSSSANDASAGTGARTVTITYYDQAGAGPNTETVTLNGTTAVNLVNTNHSFIEKIVVATAGSGGSNAGTITLFTGAAGAGTTVGTIAIGDNQTFWAHHYVPSSKTNYLTQIVMGTTGNQSGIFYMTKKSVLTANAIEYQLTDKIVTALNVDSIMRIYNSPIQTTGFSRITMYVISNGSNTTYFGSFDYGDQ